MSQRTSVSFPYTLFSLLIRLFVFTVHEYACALAHTCVCVCCVRLYSDRRLLSIQGFAR